MTDALVSGGVFIDSGAQPLTVTYKYGGGTVHGMVEECGDGRAVLVPREPGFQLPQFIRQVKCDANGEFEIDSVRPGDYYAVAIAGNGLPTWWSTVDQDSMLAKQGARITVRDGETSSAEVRVIRF
jgi:hypothetical protein